MLKHTQHLLKYSLKSSFVSLQKFSIFSAVFASIVMTGCESTSLLNPKQKSALSANSSSGITLGASGGTNATAANVLTGTYFWDQTGTSVQGSMPIAASVTGAVNSTSNSTTVTLTPTLGYWDGVNTINITDANLVSTKILSGTSIFGVAGSVTAAYSACTDNALNAAQCSTAANRYVTGTLGGHVTGAGTNTGATTTVTQTITSGYYDGTKSCQLTDANLVATNILSGATIFGVAGSVTAAYSACTDNALNASKCSTATNRYVTGTLGATITGAGTNASATTTVTQTITAGYYDGTTTSKVTDANLIAANIISGKTIFGVAGSATVLNSNQHRDPTSTQVSMIAEAVTNTGTLYTNTATGNPGGYRAIPDMNIDDDGFSGNTTTVTRTGWTNTCDSVTGASGGSANSACTCGTSGTIAQRIANCAAHGVIGTNATWSGSSKGNAGQAVWKLVTRTGNVASNMGKEVWQDQSTMQLWSSKVATSLNWCSATGSNAIAGNPVTQNDASNYCNNATYQATTNQAVSACFEDDGTYFVQTGTTQAGKGGLTRASTPAVGWRVPTKYDYQLADNHGIRFVMPDMVPTTGSYEWSATIYSGNRSNAWVFGGSYGHMSLNNRNVNYSVRCVGR